MPSSYDECRRRVSDTSRALNPPWARFRCLCGVCADGCVIYASQHTFSTRSDHRNVGNVQTTLAHRRVGRLCRAGCRPSADEMLAAARRLSEEVDGMRFAPPVTHVYNPLGYAWARASAVHREVRVDAQAGGVARHESGAVRDGADGGAVRRGRSRARLPRDQPHDGRPRSASRRTSTRSGRSPGLRARAARSAGRACGGWSRRAGAARPRSSASITSPTTARCCSWRRAARTARPTSLASGERAALSAACDRHLRPRGRAARSPAWVIGVGGYAEQQARAALGDSVQIGSHPASESGESGGQPRLGRGRGRRADRAGDLGA